MSLKNELVELTSLGKLINNIAIKEVRLVLNEAKLRMRILRK